MSFGWKLVIGIAIGFAIMIPLITTLGYNGNSTPKSQYGQVQYRNLGSNDYTMSVPLKHGTLLCIEDVGQDGGLAISCNWGAYNK